jgi:hypothetical protein
MALKKDQKGSDSTVLQIRLQKQHLGLFREAADHAGLPVSSWARERLLRVVRQELGKKA